MFLRRIAGCENGERRCVVFVAFDVVFKDA
jgi:hypothetical protein